MRLVKLALISIVALFLIITGISLLIPSHIRISRAINMEVPRDTVAAHLANLQQWHQWNKLIAGAEGNSPRATANTITSNGLQVVLATVQPDTITTTWQQQDGKPSTGTFALHTAGSTTVVQWYFDFHMRWYPWEKFGSIIFDKQLGPPMEQSLAELKKRLETSPH